MTEFNMLKLKDLGLQREVMDALPYAVVGGTWMGSFDVAIDGAAEQVLLNYVVPTGQQLKMLFLRIWSQSTGGAKFKIVQTNIGGEVGSVPSGVRDYPMLENAGAEVLRGSLRDPIHVFEGSIEFRILGPVAATGDRYAISWWGCQKIPEP